MTDLAARFVLMMMMMLDRGLDITSLGFPLNQIIIESTGDIIDALFNANLWILKILT